MKSRKGSVYFFPEENRYKEYTNYIESASICRREKEYDRKNIQK